jgi:hypothetical protein
MKEAIKKRRVVLFGAGSISKLLTKKKKKTTDIVAYVVDGSTGDVDGIPIISLDKLQEMDFDYIIVAFGNSVKGVELLKSIGVPEHKIVGYAYSGLDYRDNYLQSALDDTITQYVRNDIIPDLFDLNSKTYYVCGMNTEHSDEIIERDFVREQTLYLLSQEIYRKGIGGEVAEIGVSSGKFASKINKVFPDRMLYLYDTYEGVPHADREHAISVGWGEKQYVMDETGTDTDIILQQMPNRDKCVFKRGLFPESFDSDVEYAFISLDIDFYNSTRRGLEMTYSSLSEGGYIMVHDYHNLAFPESQKAIIDFCDTNRVNYVPIPDNGGSIIIAK